MLHNHLFARVRYVPSLSVALANMLPEDRLPHIIMVTHGLPMVEGLENVALDNEIERHIGFIHAAIDDEHITDEQKRDKRAIECMNLARWFARNAGEPKIPKSMGILLGEVAAQWSTDADENRAQAALEHIVLFYLNFKKPWLQDVVRSAINKTGANCTLGRLTKSLVTLGATEGRFKEIEGLYESISFAHLRKTLVTSPTLVRRNAVLREALGECSEVAENTVLVFTKEIARMDEVARSFVDHVRGSWKIETLDIERKVVVVLLDMPESVSEESAKRAYNGALRKNESWRNPHRDVSVELKVNYGAGKSYVGVNVRGIS